MSNTRDSLDLDEIIQNIKDDAIAHHKKWQGSPYEAKQAIHQWATAEIIAELERVGQYGWGQESEYKTADGRIISLEDRIQELKGKAKETQL